MAVIDDTHDPARRSWVDSANAPGTDFPIQNLPFGMFSVDEDARIGVAIGDFVLDAVAAGLAGARSLNELMARPPAGLRQRISAALTEGSPRLDRHLHPLSEVRMLLPAAIGDYTDFYASIFHATNVGRLFRPDNPLLPNYKWVPIAYHGRASSIVPSGTPVRRPRGQRKAGDFGPSERLDYEVELGMFIGPGNALGEPVPVGRAGEQIFGCCLVNDWSARDIQAWEYQPLGPFLAKSFATTVSPWIVTAEALAPFRAPAFARDIAPLPYLTDDRDQLEGAIDVTLEAWLNGVRLSRSNARDLYWTPAQMIAHHTSNGCNLRPGDLIATGTVSGAEETARGCLLEMGRGFLADGDEVVLRARCDRPGFRSIGFGECRGVVSPA